MFTIALDTRAPHVLSMRGLLIAIGLVTLGCGAEAEPMSYVLSVPPEENPGVTAEGADLLAACEFAARRWEGTSGVKISCTSGRPLRWEEPLDRCAVAGTNAERIAIRPGPTGCTTELWNPTPHYLAHVVAHELGHLMTSDGTHPAGLGLMGARAPVGAFIATQDLEWICDRAPCTRFVTE